VIVAFATVLVAMVVAFMTALAAPASASPLSQAGNRVGVFHFADGQRVGPHD
jgi:hypothetical protein